MANPRKDEAERGTVNALGIDLKKDYPCPKCGHTMSRIGNAQSGRPRWACHQPQGKRKAKVYCYSTTDPRRQPRGRDSVNTRNPANTKFKRALTGVKRLIITTAQNGTPVHEGFFNALLSYCRDNDAELIVIPIRYKNPTSKWTKSQEDEEWWAEEVLPYLYNQRKKLNKNLILMADIKTIPTAEKPLSGFEGMTHGESGIFGHTKKQLVTVPTPQAKLPKILTTTGAVTVPNYTDSKAGKKGEFHHTQGASVVDLKGSKFHLYQVNATKDGSFIHLDKEYRSNGRSRKAPPALGIAFGDTHRAHMDRRVERATFGPGGLVETLDPNWLVFHDLHDGYAINPHHRKNPFAAIAKHQHNMNVVEDEILADVEWLVKVTGKRKSAIVASNHDDFLARWITDMDWKLDPPNAEFYLETALQMVRSVDMDEEGAHRVDPFQYWVNTTLEDWGEPADIRCLGRDESLMLADIEMGLHGDKGANGARGSRAALKRIGVKTIIGHSHSPGIEEGCYQAGTSTPLRQEYTQGPSSWLNTHVVVYANGKRSLINVIEGAWRL